MLLVNINCHCVHLERFIKDSCRHDRSEIIDLCNETGELIGIPRRDPWEMAVGWFEPRKTYLPLTVQLGTDKYTLKSYIPWLEDFEKLYPEATESLDVQISSRHKDRKMRRSANKLPPPKAEEKPKKTPKKPSKKDVKVKKNSKSGLFD